MPGKKIAVISASGFLGKKIESLSESKGYRVMATYFPKKDGQEGTELDVTNQEAVLQFVEGVSPNAVINCSALASVDWCESHKQQCFDVNIGGVKNLANACLSANAKLVHFSTGFVFDGKKENYVEEDETNPLNVYSVSKLESEKAIREVLEDYLLIRSVDLYGFSSRQARGFVTWLLNNLREGKEFGVVNDQFSQPTLIDDLANAVLRLIELNKKGIFHIVGPDYISKYHFALMVAQTFGFNPELIKPISTAESPLKSKRPMTLRMSTKKAASLGIKVRKVEDGLALMKEQMQQSEKA